MNILIIIRAVALPVTMAGIGMMSSILSFHSQPVPISDHNIEKLFYTRECLSKYWVIIESAFILLAVYSIFKPTITNSKFFITLWLLQLLFYHSRWYSFTFVP